MEYRIEKLLPIVAELADKYTSKESSSVTYEQADRLMETVVYCIRECSADGRNAVDSGRQPDERALYERGRKLVLEKTYRAKMIYERIIRDFEDYGCRNYRDTVLEGMPEFFVRYDPVFAPGNHLLMLDYPLLAGSSRLCGVDLILEYLAGIQAEARFLNQFHPGVVRRLLQAVMPDYRELYLDNLCDPVLIVACGCILVGKPVEELELMREDCDVIREHFRGKSGEEISRMMAGTIRTVVSELPGCERYFQRAADGYGARIRNGVEKDCLEAVFHVAVV